MSMARWLLVPGMGRREINRICPIITPTLGAERVSNGTFNVDLANWSNHAGLLDTFAWDAGEMHIAETGVDYSNATQGDVWLVGQWHQYGYKATQDAGAALYLQEGANTTVRAIVATQTLEDAAHLAAVGGNIRFKFFGAAGEWHIDDVSVRQITFSSTLAALGFRKPLAGVYRCHPTVADDTVTGLVIHYADDNNFVLAIVDRQATDRVRIYSRIAGTYTQAGQNTIAYGAGNELRIEVDAAGNYSLYYNDVIRVNPVAIAQGTLGYQVHGFNTYDGNTVGQVATSKN